MVLAKPHFLLFCDAHVTNRAIDQSEAVGGRWHFVLERIDVPARLEAADSERSVPRDRLSLLAVVRGLEALEQPSAVTLVTTSRYVSRGLRFGLGEWRESNYIWEHFGEQKPVRNADLWQRIDGAMHFHEVACRLLESSAAPQTAAVAERAGAERAGAERAGALEPKPIDSRPAESLVPVESDNSLIPAPHFGRRAAASVARVRRSNSGPEPHWWRQAAGFAHWWRRRGERTSLLAGV